MTDNENAPGTSSNSTGGNDENLTKDSVEENITEETFSALMGQAGILANWIAPEWAKNRADGFFLPYGDPCATWESERFGTEQSSSISAFISRVDFLTAEGNTPGNASICIEYAGKEQDLELTSREARSLALALMDAADLLDRVEGKR